MSTERALYLSDLNPDLPRGNESIGELDDHLREIKTCYKNSFTNADYPLNVTQNQMNGIPYVFNYDINGNVLFIGPNYDFSGSDSKTFNLDSQNCIITGPDGQYPIGIVFWSIMTKLQMQNNYGSNYVICDGSNISTTSSYYRLYGKTKVPDLINQANYCRPSYSLVPTAIANPWVTYDIGVGTIQPSNTIKNGINLSVAVTNHTHDVSHTHNFTNNTTGRVPGQNKQATGASGDYLQGVDGNAEQTTPGFSSVLLGLNNIDHTHLITVKNLVFTDTNELKRYHLNPFIRID